MKVNKEKEENRQAFLKIEMEPAEVEEYLKESYHRLASKTNVPGFRKGKAPRAVLERYIGKERLLEEAISRLVPKACEQAIREQELEAFGRPSVEIEQTDPVVFTATVPLKPQVSLGDYHKIRLTPEPVKVTEDDVNAVLEQLRRQHSNWGPVEREVKLDDLVTLDISGSIDGKQFTNQSAVQYEVLPGYPPTLPGFAGQLVGVKVGGEKEFKLQLAKDYPSVELAGKEAQFRVKVSEVKERRLPQLDDEFATSLDPELKTLASLRERISTNLRLRAEEKARGDFEEKLIDSVVEISQVEFPPVLVEAEIVRLLDQQARWLQASGSRINKSGEELREELRPLAVKRVTRSLVLERMSEAEKIGASEAEIKAELERLAPTISGNKDEVQKWLDSPQAHRSVEQVLIRRKTIQLLVEIAGDSKKAGGK